MNPALEPQPLAQSPAVSPEVFSQTLQRKTPHSQGVDGAFFWRDELTQASPRMMLVKHVVENSSFLVARVRGNQEAVPLLCTRQGPVNVIRTEIKFSI